MWGMDVIGPISPPSSKGHRFILAITDCFSKWAEAIPLREVKTFDVVKFVKHHVIYRFGVPRRIVHDNGPQFVSQVIEVKPAQKIRNFRTFNKNVQVLNSFAIASGYAGRDPQGGFCLSLIHI